MRLEWNKYDQSALDSWGDYFDGSDGLFNWYRSWAYASEPRYYLYIIKSGRGYFKIGVTKDIERRMKDLSVGNPIDLELMILFANYEMDRGNSNIKCAERILHSKLKDKHVRGEWFELGRIDLLKIYHFIKSNFYFELKEHRLNVYYNISDENMDEILDYIEVTQENLDRLDAQIKARDEGAGVSI